MLLSSDITKDYANTFIQPVPRYGIKTGGGWYSRNGSITYKMIEKHLTGKITIGSLARYYPEHAVIDIDDRSIEHAEEIREQLNLNDRNSMMYASESKDSWHIFIKPQYRGKPPTINLLSDILNPVINKQDVELYPQKNKYCRSPFSKTHIPLDPHLYFTDKVQQFNSFKELDEYPLEYVPKSQIQLDLETVKAGKSKSLTPYKEGEELFNHGLQISSSRNESQFKVLYYLWRKGTPIEKAQAMTLNWIYKKHNGYSKEIITSPHRVKGEIKRQAIHIWSKYTSSGIYPDSTNNDYFGWITEENFIDLVKLSKGNLSEIRFYFELFKYCNARQTRKKGVSMHRNLLTLWGSEKNYMKYMNKLEKLDFIKRQSAFLPGLFSKRVTPLWRPQSISKQIIIDNRSPELNQTVIEVIKPNEYRNLLLSLGVSKNTISNQITRFKESI